MGLLFHMHAFFSRMILAQRRLRERRLGQFYAALADLLIDDLVGKRK